MSPAARHSPQEQEDLVLEAAVRCIEESSLLDFKMASIAKAAGLSMGSVYKHIQSKEDVLFALATRMGKQHLEVFEDIMSMPLSMPERLVACVLVSPHKLHSYSFGIHLEMLINNESVLRRASQRWKESYARFDHALAVLFEKTMVDAWAAGELMVEEGQRDELIETVLLSLWSMSTGFTHISYRQAQTPADVDPAQRFPLAPDHPLVHAARALIGLPRWRRPLDDEGVSRACALLEERGYR